jgi:hypothetical protein
VENAPKIRRALLEELQKHFQRAGAYPWQGSRRVGW